MKALPILAAGLLLAFAQPAAAKWQFTYWTMTVDDVVKASGGLAKPGDPADMAGRRLADLDTQAKLTMPFKFGTLNFNAYFLFMDDRLMGVSLEGRDPEIEKAFETLTTQYGEPYRQIEDSSRATMIWSTPDEDFITVRYQPGANPGEPGHMTIDYEPRP